MLSLKGSCKGRCGIQFYRGYECQCDYGCLAHDECCRDYESQCTQSKDSIHTVNYKVNYMKNNQELCLTHSRRLSGYFITDLEMRKPTKSYKCLDIFIDVFINHCGRVVWEFVCLTCVCVCVEGTHVRAGVGKPLRGAAGAPVTLSV